MTESERVASTMPQPLFFGLLEGLCFLCLFGSSLYSQAEAYRIWVAVGMLRTVVFAVALLPDRSALGRERCSNTRAAQLLIRGLLYQVPFWISALLFPLHEGQFYPAAAALLVQSSLFASLVVLARRGGPVGAESLVFLLSLAWLLSWRPPGLWLGVAAMGLLATFRGTRSRRGWGWELGFGHGLAVGAAWLGGFVFPALGPTNASSTGTMLLCWLLLLYIAAVMSAMQREISSNEEIEAALPQAGGAGRVWLLGRRSAVVALGWMALVTLAVKDAPEGIAVAILATSWWRAIELGARRWFTADRLVWWAALEITLIWVAFQGSSKTATAILFVAVGYGVLVVQRRAAAGASQSKVERATGFAELELALVNGLRQSAPSGFSARVLEETESVELDKDLAAAAPAGFRERLMQRLRQTGEEEE